MCFHWQQAALQRYSENLKYKNLYEEITILEEKHYQVMCEYARYRDKHNNSLKQKALWLFDILIFNPIYNLGKCINPKLNYYVCKLRPSCLVYFVVPYYPRSGFYGGQLAFIRGQLQAVQSAIASLNPK